MTEPGGWNTPDGWGGPTQPPAPVGQPTAPASGQPAPPDGQPAPPYGQPAPPYGQPAPPYGQQWGQPAPPDGQQQWGQPAPQYGQQQWGQPAPPYGQQQWGQPQWGQQQWGYQAPKPGVVPLRPLGLGELLDGAVAIVRRYPRPTLGLSAIIALVTTLANIALLAFAFRPFFELDEAAIEACDTDAVLGALGPAAVGSAVTVLLAVLGGTLMTGAITAVVGKAVLGEPLTFAETWKQVRRQFPRLLALALLVILICTGILLLGVAIGAAMIAISGWLAFIGVPVILASIGAALYVFYRLALAPCVMVLERAGVLPSMRRSGVLVKGDWWRVFGILLLTALISGIVGQIIQVPFAFAGTGGIGGVVDPGDELFGVRYLTMTALGQGLAATLITPFSAGVLALLYVDRRMRAEGLDVALAAAAHDRP